MKGKNACIRSRNMYKGKLSTWNRKLHDRVKNDGYMGICAEFENMKHGSREYKGYLLGVEVALKGLADASAKGHPEYLEEVNNRIWQLKNYHEDLPLGS